MAAPRFRVDGVELISYILEDGLTIQKFDIDAPDAGRTLDGLMHRNRVATKYKIQLDFRPLTASQLMTVERAFEPEFFTVQFYDPADGNVSIQMYKGDSGFTQRTAYTSNTGLYVNYNVHLIQR